MFRCRYDRLAVDRSHENKPDWHQWETLQFMVTARSVGYSTYYLCPLQSRQRAASDFRRTVRVSLFQIWADGFVTAAGYNLGQSKSILGPEATVGSWWTPSSDLPPNPQQQHTHTYTHIWAYRLCEWGYLYCIKQSHCCALFTRACCGSGEWCDSCLQKQAHLYFYADVIVQLTAEISPHQTHNSSLTSHYSELLKPASSSKTQKLACLLHLLCSKNPEILICWVDCASVSLQPVKIYKIIITLAHAPPTVCEPQTKECKIELIQSIKTKVTVFTPGCEISLVGFPDRKLGEKSVKWIFFLSFLLFCEMLLFFPFRPLNSNESWKFTQPFTLWLSAVDTPNRSVAKYWFST